MSLANIWRNWFRFKRGKRKTPELETFTYFLEENLRQLHFDLVGGRYKHGGYKKFIVIDNKHREISVASIRDRVVHRLLYEYLTAIYDKTFIYDAWSCRKNKGLIGAIGRTQKFLSKYRNNFIWRTDVKKFFDNVDHETLQRLISCRITDRIGINLLQKVIGSYSVRGKIRERERVKTHPAKACPSAI